MRCWSTLCNSARRYSRCGSNLVYYGRSVPLTVPPVVDEAAFAGRDQPTITVDGEFTLRPFDSADTAVVLEAFATPDIQLWHGFRIDDLDQAQDWISRTHSLWNEAQSAVWAIVNSTGVLGRCALHIDCRRGTAEIAYWLLPEARGKGVASRAVTTVTDWAHPTLGVHRILLQHSTKNSASCAVAERTGYIAEGVAREQDIHVDGWHDMHQHAHLSTD